VSEGGSVPEIVRLVADNERMRAALQEIAHRTIQRDLNRLAHEALGHAHNPVTVRLLAEIEIERQLSRLAP
jgi:hypothetical protein